MIEMLPEYLRAKQIEWQLAARMTMLDTAPPHMLRLMRHAYYGEDPRPTNWERILEDDFEEVS